MTTCCGSLNCWALFITPSCSDSKVAGVLCLPFSEKMRKFSFTILAVLLTFLIVLVVFPFLIRLLSSEQCLLSCDCCEGVRSDLKEMFVLPLDGGFNFNLRLAVTTERVSISRDRMRSADGRPNREAWNWGFHLLAPGVISKIFGVIITLARASRPTVFAESSDENVRSAKIRIEKVNKMIKKVMNATGDKEEETS